MSTSQLYSQIMLLSFAAIGALAFFLAALFFLRHWLRHLVRQGKIIRPGARRSLLLVLLPKESLQSQESRDHNLQALQEEIGVAETFFSSLGSLKSQKGFKAFFLGRDDHLSFELVAQGGMISFYVAVSETLRQYVEEQVHAQFPHASIQRVEDYNIFSPKLSVAIGQLAFKKQNFFPLRTYKNMEGDPLNALIQTLAKVPEGEGVAVQYVVRSASPSWRRVGVKVAREMKQGKRFPEALRAAGANPFLGALGSLFKALAEVLFGKGNKPEESSFRPEGYQLSPMDEEMARSIEEKCSKAGLDVNIRIVAAGTSPARAKAYLENVANAFGQHSIYEYGNALTFKIPRHATRLGADFIHRNFLRGSSLVLNTEEMSSLFHFPLPSTETPRIRWLAARRLPAPVGLPDEGLLLGENDYRGQKRLVHMKDADRRRHMYVIGQTGTGKSWFAEGLAIQDIRAGRGVCFVDPHGEGVDHILERIPKERADDVIVFDPADTERPMAMNMLEHETEEQKIFVVDTILQIFDKLYDMRSTGGPMFEQYMRNTLLLIMDDPGSGMTLAEVPRVLADEKFRKLKLSRCKTPVVKDFWEKEAQKAGGEASLANMVPYITSKLTPFIANALMRPMVSQQKSSFSFREAMDTSKIILVKLSKGKIGDLNANLLGMITINKILMAALGRASIPEAQRRDFYLYIDEFQNFLTDSISIILSEARKYKLNLTLIHQFIAQLVSKESDTKIRDAVFGNVGTVVAFRIGVDDTELMARQLAPAVSEFDLLNIEKYNAYVRLLVDNAAQKTFNISSFPLPEGDPEQAAKIARLSSLRYGRDRAVVEAEVADRTACLADLMK